MITVTYLFIVQEIKEKEKSNNKKIDKKKIKYKSSSIP